MKINSFTRIQVCLWRAWDFFIKLIWRFVTNNLKNLLWRFIYSKDEIKIHIEDSMTASQGVVIQVGSNDGVSNDPLYESILKHKRKSFLVEPIDYLADKLRLLHGGNSFVIVCEFAIHPNSNAVDFFHLSKDAQKQMGDLWKPWFDQIGSFSRQHLIKHSPTIEPFIQKTSITCKTLNQLIVDNNVSSVSILHIDAEGFDLEVLRSMDLDKVKPHMIMLEHKHLNMYPLFSLIGDMRRRGYLARVYHDDILFINNS
jgi:FkbM family methyltransferase